MEFKLVSHHSYIQPQVRVVYASSIEEAIMDYMQRREYDLEELVDDFNTYGHVDLGDYEIYETENL